MTAVKEPTMGRFSVEVELANHEDLFRQAGLIPPEQVAPGTSSRGSGQRRCARSFRRRFAATRLGNLWHAKVRYADGRVAERPIVKDIHLAYGGRESVFNAIVEPDRESVLIGAIVLEDLDFLVDCVGQRLVPHRSKLSQRRNDPSQCQPGCASDYEMLPSGRLAR